MSRFFLGLLLGCLFPFSDLSAQITLDFADPSLSTFQFQVIKLQHSGTKYMDNSKLEQLELNLYNLDGSLFNQIILPPEPFGTTNRYVYGVSESLFDLDSTNIEYLIVYARTFDPTPGDTSGATITFAETHILSENGTLHFKEKGASLKQMIPGLSPNPYLTEDGFKIALSITDTLTGAFEGVKVYSLPGSMPTALKTDEEAFDFGAQLYPNPSYGALNISWKNQGSERKQVSEVRVFSPEGRLLEQIEVAPSQQKIVRQTSLYPAGVYMYQLLNGEGEVLQSNKVMILR